MTISSSVGDEKTVATLPVKNGNDALLSVFAGLKMEKLDRDKDMVIYKNLNEIVSIALNQILFSFCSHLLCGDDINVYARFSVLISNVEL
jgi:hypothetical protein